MKPPVPNRGQAEGPVFLRGGREQQGRLGEDHREKEVAGTEKDL